MEIQKRFTVSGIAKSPAGKIVDKFFTVLSEPCTKEDAEELAYEYEAYFADFNINAVAKVKRISIFHVEN